MNNPKQKQTPTGFSKIQIDETLRETIPHGTPDYAFQFYEETMDMFDFRCVDWHWHSELEIMLVENGSLDCLVGTEHYVLNTGDAIFINTKVIHKYTSKQNAIVPNILFSSTFLSTEDSLIYKKYILPVLQSISNCQVFSATEPKDQKSLELIRTVIQIQRQENRTELATIEKLLAFWGEIYRNTDLSKETSASACTLRGQTQLQRMMQMMQENYSLPLSLEEIAASVHVSKSTALHIFSRYLQDTPIHYLIVFRLKKAAELLKNTEKKIDSIAMETGFDSDAYFCRCFKKHFGMTPRDYRRNRLK